MQVACPLQVFILSAKQEKYTTSLSEIFKTVTLHNPAWW